MVEVEEVVEGGTTKGEAVVADQVVEAETTEYILGDHYLLHCFGIFNLSDGIQIKSGVEFLNKNHV